VAEKNAQSVLHEPPWLRAALIALAVLVMLGLVVLPLLMVLGAAFGDGFKAWWTALL
jgi:sulfate transport system permease protein